MRGLLCARLLAYTLSIMRLLSTSSTGIGRHALPLLKRQGSGVLSSTNKQFVGLGHSFSQGVNVSATSEKAQTAVPDHALYQAALQTEAFDQQHSEEIEDFICTYMDGLDPDESFDNYKLQALCQGQKIP